MLPLSEIDWQKMLARLDETLLGATERYLRLRRLSGPDIARGPATLIERLSSGHCVGRTTA
jgi:hypothetical protein